MKWEYLLAVLLALLVGYLMFIMMVPFFIPIFWGAVLVVLFYPYYRWLLKKTGQRTYLASLIACLSIAIFIIVPLAIIGTMMAGELLNLYNWAEGYLQQVSTKAHKSPLFIVQLLEKYVGSYVDVHTINLKGIFASTVREAAAYAGQSLTGFVKSFAEFFINLFLAFFSMYFLFKDGDKLFEIIKDLIPITDHHKDMIIAKNRGVIYATIYGGIMVGLVQALLGGLAFWFLGVPAALLLGFVMFFATFLPSVGSSLVWGPVAAYLFLKGDIFGGTMLVIWGVFVIGLVDNILRPYIIGGKTNLHPLLLFFSIFGAVNVFGLIGIIAGPLILSIGQAVIEFYHEYVKSQNTWAG
ncbi:MAG: AI-2E family transporter [Deltaproteobacteria bacterium]|nr:AI-2E family transporter [Deltaproteobacteria bacterium]